MTYEPRSGSTERGRDVIVTPQGPNYGGIVAALLVVVLAVLLAVWVFTSDGEGGTDTTSPTETSVPVETTVPTETPTTIAP